MVGLIKSWVAGSSEGRWVRGRHMEKLGVETRRFEYPRDEVSNKRWPGLLQDAAPQDPSLDCTGAEFSSQWSLGLFLISPCHSVLELVHAFQELSEPTDSRWVA